jgi:hypothetical protein
MTGLRDFLANEYVHPTLERAIGEASDVLAGPDLAALEDMMKEYGDMPATIVADPAGGLALVPGYPDVSDYLATGDGDAVEMSQAVAAFLGERSVPSFVVRRLAAVNPERFERLVGSAIRDDSFKVETDLDDLIDELKPEEYTADSLEMDDEVLTPDDLEDVRTLPAELRAEGTIAAAAVAFLNDPVTVKLGRTIDELARSLSLLTYYGDIYSSSLLSDLDRQTLIDFLAAWYPRSWSERGEDDALSLLGSLELFARWLTAHDASPVGETFINEVLPELERDLPRTVEAAVVLDAGITAADLTDLVDDEDEAVAEDAIDGLFEIAMIDLDENVLTLIERFEGDEQEQIPTPGYEIEVPLRAAALLECSDLIDGVIVRRDGVWKLVDVAAVYCAVADV